jgi:hypothetical protein
LEQLAVIGWHARFVGVAAARSVDAWLLDGSAHCDRRYTSQSAAAPPLIFLAEPIGSAIGPFWSQAGLIDFALGAREQLLPAFDQQLPPFANAHFPRRSSMASGSPLHPF